MPRFSATRLFRTARMLFGDPWQVAGTLALVCCVAAVGLLFAHARALSAHTNKHTHEFTIVAVSSPYPSVIPSPLDQPSPTPDSTTPSPSPSPAPVAQVAPLTGAQVTAPPTARATSRSTPRPTPPGASDNPPVARLSVTVVGRTVTANASASSDSDSTPIASYLFDFGDGHRVGPGPTSVAANTYQTAYQYTVTVWVTDTAGLVSSVSQTIVVGP